MNPKGIFTKRRIMNKSAERSEKRIFIMDEEREKCQRIADAFSDLEDIGILVLNAGKYGFIKLLYYRFPDGFDNAIAYTDSRILFNDLWEDWICSKLHEIGVHTSTIALGYEEIFHSLSKEEQNALMDKRYYFAEKAGITEPFDTSCTAQKDTIIP